MKQCDFCSSEIINSRSIFFNDNFYLVQDLYPVIDLHFLVIAKKHVLSMAHLGDIILISLIQFAKHCQRNLGLQHLNMHIFERGNIQENKTNIPSLDHAHAHIFFGDFDICSKLKKSYDISDISELTKIINYNSYYFYFESFSNIKKYGLSRDVPSQFIRKCISESSSGVEWNWRKREINQINNDP